MTLVSFTLIMVVALVNLTLGFGAAALVGRGPWSTRARNAHSIAGDDTSTTPADESSNDQDPDESNGSVESTDAAATPAETPTDHDPQTMQSVAAAIELIEQNLQELLKQIQVNGESPHRKMLPQWAAIMIGQANQLNETHDEFRRLAEQSNLPADIQRPTLETLDHLQQQFQATVVAIGQVKTTNIDRRESVTRLLTACQETRGAINAASFVQSQP